MSTKEKRYVGGPMWNWFGLSYAAYLVIPRSILCRMSVEWQIKFAALLDECVKEHEGKNIEDNYMVKLKGTDGKFKKDPLKDYRLGDPFS